MDNTAHMEARMTEAALQGFRQIADIMAGDEPRDWQWNGRYMSQQMYGITEARAKDYAERFGGTASKMQPLTLEG